MYINIWVQIAIYLNIVENIWNLGDTLKVFWRIMALQVNRVGRNRRDSGAAPSVPPHDAHFLALHIGARSLLLLSMV